MVSARALGIGAIAVACALLGNLQFDQAARTGVVLTAPAAQAQTYRAEDRRVARRTARRTSRRVTARNDYLRTLPGGCARRGAYYYCGGVYYQPIVQDGATVYIVVNP